MKTESEVTRNWDDLIFEKRNKAYGAYSVRKSYSQNITTGLGISVCVACIVLFTPRIMSILFPTDLITEDPLPRIDCGITILPPPLVEVPVVPQQQPPMRRTVENLAPEVTTNPDVTEDTPTNTQIVESMDGSDTGTGDAPTHADLAPVTPVPPAPVEETTFNYAEEMPEYEGGFKEMMQFIGRKVRYPGIARRNGIEGTVFVSFVVNKDGKVTDVNVSKGISDECDKEAARVIALLDKWSPGKQNHRTVNVRMTIPIKFQLDR